MIISYFVSVTCITLIQAALIDRKRALEKNFLDNLASYHAGIKNNLIPPHNTLMGKIPPAESIESKLNDEASTGIKIIDLSTDIQQFILTFLTPQDLFITRLVNSLYFKLSNNANYINLYNYNPDFVLKETWMNLTLNNFLYKNFKNGRLNVDDLIMTINDILFNITEEHFKDDFYEKIPITLTILSFLYEYENGVGSSLPLNNNEIYVEIYKRIFKGEADELPRSMDILKLSHRRFISSNRRLKLNFERFFYNSVELKKSSSYINAETIMESLQIIPNESLNDSGLRYLPKVFQVLLFDLVLPLSNTYEILEEALDIFELSEIHSQEFIDHLERHEPGLLRSFYEDDEAFLLQRVHKALARKFHRREIVGLDYLLSRDSANPFDINTLMAMNPNVYKLITHFKRSNTLSLTEIDMLSQMKEAGLFDGIRDPGFHESIKDILSHYIRFENIEKLKLFCKNGF